MTKYFGYLKESYFRKKGNGDHYICDIYTDETVIYGTKQGQNTTLVFSIIRCRLRLWNWLTAIRSRILRISDSL